MVSISLQRSSLPLLFAPLQLHDQPALALLDSGSSAGLRLSTRLANRLGLSLTLVSGASVRGLDGRSHPLARTRLRQLSVGEWRRNDVEAEVAGERIEQVSAQVGTDFDVQIGWGWLRRQPFVLDGPALRLHLDGKPSLSKAGLTLAYVERGGLPLLEARIDDQPVQLLLDSGAPQCNLDLPEARARAGQMVTRALSLGSWRASVPWRVKDLSVQRGALGTAGTLGLEWLLAFVLAVDPARQQLNLS